MDLVILIAGGEEGKPSLDDVVLSYRQVRLGGVLRAGLGSRANFFFFCWQFMSCQGCRD